MDYFSEQEGYTHSLPDPSDTPYHTPVPSASRRSSRFGASSPQPPSSSPAPLPPDPTNGSDPANDEKISILDPRRFTPTLHANLVSEILSLRRELDSKHKFIEGLETNLQVSKSESENLSHDLAQRRKENRSLKGQLQQLEHGTLSAMEQLAKEKDDLKVTNEDLKVKLESSQKKVKSREAESTRVHLAWEREKEQWDGERRGFERRVHATETRLRIVLDELAVHQAAQQDAHQESEVEDQTMDSGLGNDSDTASIRSRSNSRNGSHSRLSRHGRTMSNSSYKSLGRLQRFSTVSNGLDGSNKPNGLSLADELKFDEEDEDLEDLELDSDDFPENEMRARRALESRQSNHQDDKAKRILGLMDGPKSPTVDALEFDLKASFDSSTLHAESIAEGEQPASTEYIPSRASREGWAKNRRTPSTVYEVDSVDTAIPRPDYVDSSVQYSPLPSPKQALAPSNTSDIPLDEVISLSEINENEANQRRKRVSATPTTPSLKPVESKDPIMISSSVQTVDMEPLSPPATPKTESESFTQDTVPIPPKPETSTTSTQTDPVVFAEPGAEQKDVPMVKKSGPPAPISVPSIVISPTMSAPSSPQFPVLPPNTRSVAVQASFITRVPMKSASMQTESVMSDPRLAKLPPHLLPSAIRLKPGTPEPNDGRDSRRTSELNNVHERFLVKNALFRLGQDKNATQNVKADTQTEDRYPGNNDNGVIAQNKGEGIRRPFRTSSLFAGFHGGSSEDEEADADLSDEDGKIPIRSAPAAPTRSLKHKRPFGSPPTPVPEENEAALRNSRELSRMSGSPRNSVETTVKVSKSQRSSGSQRSNSIRRSALIQSGQAAHLQRSRSPSLGSNNSTDLRRYVPKPPFPVPTRSSSRRVPLSKSEGSQSPTHRPNGYPGRPTGYKSKLGRQDSLRKVRSAAVIPRGASRQRSRSPPLSSQPSETSHIPPLPNDIVTSPSYTFTESPFGHQAQASTNTVLTGSASIGSSQSNSVVDAIAATMVGEWMWKYVRKRKSFGVPESPLDHGDDSGNGARHKRWVWLSPYERAVMWSSKQPTNGTALLGKSGRKLTIQSVLDVPDNTPSPRAAPGNQIFNRSILILTPARALKFTAVSKERHYLWLTALSFLASSGNGNHELETSAAPPPPIPTHAPPEPPVVQQLPQSTLRRSHIRDSVRLAKERSQPSMHQGGGHAEPIPEHLPSRGGSSIADAAIPPSVPRWGHGRKRSSTGPRVPPPINTSFRSYSQNHAPQIHSAGIGSVYSAGSSDMYGAPPSAPSSIYNPPSGMTSARQSEASSSIRHNLFDAMGTVRMEAFVAETTKMPGEDNNMSSSMRSNVKRPVAGRRRGGSQFSDSTNAGIRLLEEMGYDPNDPFRGF